MKFITVLLFNLGALMSLHAQVEHPVKWAYGTKKTGTNTYEIHLKATMDNGWHVYAQKQPENSVSKPTIFKFQTGDQFVLIGKTKEIGKLIDFEDAASGLGAKEYSNSVDFVQVVKLNNSSLRHISGIITYQACTDKMCLPPDDISFTVPLK